MIIDSRLNYFEYTWIRYINSGKYCVNRYLHIKKEANSLFTCMIVLSFIARHFYTCVIKLILMLPNVVPSLKQTQMLLRQILLFNNFLQFFIQCAWKTWKVSDILYTLQCWWCDINQKVRNTKVRTDGQPAAYICSNIK